MYPQHTDLSQTTPNLSKTNSQPTSSNNSRNSSPQSSLPCGQRTLDALTSSSDVPSTTSHQPQLPTKMHHTSPSPHNHHTPPKTNINQSSQSSITGEDQQCVPKSADGTQVKRSKQQTRQPDECLCFHCNLPGHIKRNCPEIPYCSKCRTNGHTQDRCMNKPQQTRHTHSAGKPRDQQKRKDDLLQFPAITISVCSVEEITMLPSVHNDSHHLLMPVLLVQVFPLTNIHLVLHAHLLLTRNRLPHVLNLHCMYEHPLLT